MNEKNMVTMERIPAISAIYYALLCEGYDFFAIEKQAELVQRLQTFAGEGERFPFFASARQNTCEVYPYWPRAAILESAALNLNDEGDGYADFPALREKIMSAGNIAGKERGETLWRWLAAFPSALREVLGSEGFWQYSLWETAWLARQNALHAEELRQVQSCLDVCVRRYASPVRRVTVALNPIKCAYSADYHLAGDAFVFSSGRFSGASVVHEFLHHVVHGAVEAQRTDILRVEAAWTEIDRSYYLDGGETGRLNAFEEHCVRQLTARVCAGAAPMRLDAFIAELLAKGAK